MICLVIHSLVLGSLPVFLAMELGLNFDLILTGAMGVACFGGAYFVIKRKRERVLADASPPQQTGRKSHQFFDEMSDRLSLTEEEETLLITLTDELELTSPALLLVEPKHLKARSQDDSEDSQCAMLLLPKLYGEYTVAEGESGVE